MQPPKSVHAADTRRPRNPPDASHPRQQAQDLSKRPNLSQPFFPLSRRTQGNHRHDKSSQDKAKRERRERTNPPRRPRHPAEPARGRPDMDERSRKSKNARKPPAPTQSPKTKPTGGGKNGRTDPGGPDATPNRPEASPTRARRGRSEERKRARKGKKLRVPPKSRARKRARETLPYPTLNLG